MADRVVKGDAGPAGKCCGQLQASSMLDEQHDNLMGGVSRRCRPVSGHVRISDCWTRDLGIAQEKCKA